MKKCLCFVWILAVLAFAGGDETNAAIKAAQSWLALVDSGNYAQSWDAAAQVFKSGVTKDQWVPMVDSARSRFGKVVSRTLKSALYTRTLPGAPDGDYVVIQYDTNFDKQKSSVERITPMREKDGQWRISGYYIK